MSRTAATRWGTALALTAGLFLLCAREAEPPASSDLLTLEFETEEVTDPDLAASSDGETLVFTLLGHLFRVSCTGGDAEQLTFGLGYDFDPVFSPGGERLVFVSDREGTEGNLFLLELESGEIRQLTHEAFGVARPAWSVDGGEILYLNLLPPNAQPMVYLPTHYPSTVRAVDVATGESRTLDDRRLFRTSVVSLPEGRWAAAEVTPDDRFAWESGRASGPAWTRIVARDARGSEDTLATVPGIIHRVSLAPGGGGFVARHLPAPHARGWGLMEEHVAVIPTSDEVPIRHLARVTGSGGWDWGPEIGVQAESGSVFFGREGRLAAVSLGDGAIQEIPFRARVEHLAFVPETAPAWTPPDPRQAVPLEVTSPRPLPEGRGTLVLAAGQLWRIPAGTGDGEPVLPERVHGEFGLVRVAEPSPQGDRVALVVREHDLEFLEILTLADPTAAGPDPGLVRDVAGGGPFDDLVWSPDGTSLTYRDPDGEGRLRVDLATGQVTPSVGEGIPERAEPDLPPGIWDLRFPFPTPPPTLITDVRILDFRAAGFTRATSVLVEDGRIRAIGTPAMDMAPDDARMLDGAGRYLVPGFIDMHWHFYGIPSLAAFLPLYGVTSVREVGSGGTGIHDSRTMADLGNLHPGLVPRVFYSNFYSNPTDVAETSPAEFRELGASWIKAYATLPWATQAEVAAASREAGLPVAAHGWHTREVVKGLTLGYASLEHMGYGWHDDLIQLARATGVAWVPTVGNMSADLLLAMDHPERRGGPAAAAFGREQDPLVDPEHHPHGAASVLREFIGGQFASLQRAHEAGIPVLVGTDLAGPGALVGQATLWEIQHLVSAGIPPIAVLRAATLGAAEVLGAGPHLGSVEVGKLADLVILDADPLQDIRAVEGIWRVMKGGWLLDPEAAVERMAALRKSTGR